MVLVIINDCFVLVNFFRDHSTFNFLSCGWPIEKASTCLHYPTCLVLPNLLNNFTIKSFHSHSKDGIGILVPIYYKISK